MRLLVYGWRSIPNLLRRFWLIRGRFWVFCPAGATLCTDGVKFGTAEETHRCNDKVIGPPKLKFLLIFDQNVEYTRPAGAYSFHDFHKIWRICTSFQVALAIKVLLGLLKGLWSYWRFNLTGCGYPQIFSVPSGETYASEGDRINRSRRILTRNRALWVS